MKYGLAAFFMQKMEGIFMATKNKIINIKVFFDGDQDASPCGGEKWRRNTQKERPNRNLFELFADILQIIEVNLTERCFMSIMIP